MAYFSVEQTLTCQHHSLCEHVLFTLSEVVLNLIALWRPAWLRSNICQSGTDRPTHTNTSTQPEITSQLR